MAYFHPNLSQEKWNSLSKDKQILNIASEMLRARNSLTRNRQEDFIHSLNRILELTDLSVSDRVKWQNGSLKELLRFRENLSSYYSKGKRSEDYFQKLIRCLLNFSRESSLVKI